MTVRVNDKRRYNPDGTPRAGVPDPEPQPETAPAPPGAAQPAVEPDEVTQLRAELEAARRRVDELARGIQDVMREREEFKQRIQRERERLIEVEKGQVALALIEAIDELDHSLAADDGSPFAQGVRLIRDKLLQKLQASGIERLDLVGRPYDPKAAEAVDMELVSSPEQGDRVLSEQRAGYAQRGRVIRPGRVKVGRYVEPAKA
ncbi:MAG TPA: nucleotide exchange factor GrpE [Myxococcaceae bacterium]|nr:nucleotide exchange factor GrpE [Myxococcaceae bacterium]